MLDEKYIGLMNKVLAVNYYGEVWAIEILANLLANPWYDFLKPTLTRQLLDETRHANATRTLLCMRGRDPLLVDRRSDFTFHEVFRDFSSRRGWAPLALLTENEAGSSRTFSQLLRIARSLGDHEVASLYDEILRDESSHATTIAGRLPADDCEVLAARTEARDRMQKARSLRYLALFAAYGPRRRSSEDRA